MYQFDGSEQAVVVVNQELVFEPSEGLTITVRLQQTPNSAGYVLIMLS